MLVPRFDWSAILHRSFGYVIPWYLMVLVASLAGARYGRRQHDKFLAKKLARLERKAAKEAAKQDPSTLQSQATGQASAPNSSATQDRAPNLVNVPMGADDTPPQPHGFTALDPFQQIEKLARLRKSGALTDEEFQAKKTEILGRI